MPKNDGSIKGKRFCNWKKWLAYGVLVCFIISAILIGIALHGIGADVREACSKAQLEFEGDCVEALTAYLIPEERTFKEQNDAIWALGRIGDKRALPTLEQLYTGEPCLKPCDSSQYICQYGLENSIKSCKGFNVVRWVWRWI